MRILARLALASLLLIALAPHADAAERAPIMDAMQVELQRCMAGLKAKGDPPPYFLAYEVTEVSEIDLQASFGALTHSTRSRTRHLDVEVRLGDPTDASRGGPAIGFGTRDFPLDDSPAAVRDALWTATEMQYRVARRTLAAAQASEVATIHDPAQQTRFVKQPPQTEIEPLAEASVDVPQWEERLRRYSALFKSAPSLHDGVAELRVRTVHRFLVNSEGTAVQSGATHCVLSLYGRTRAADGMELLQYEPFDATTPQGLPDDPPICEAVQHVIRDLLALQSAPLLEPYAGPAILSGRAAAVFFHENLGHRVEGQRNDPREGQTLTKKLGHAIMPSFISVFDDPTVQRIGVTSLNGTYRFDDEGVPASRVAVVERGVLRNFLQSRTPTLGAPSSNGHGRREAGYPTVARQANLIVESSERVSEVRLRQMMRAECRRLGLPFGLYFAEIQGGFTFTQRGMPQMFQINPIMVYRVYVDGRPDELVRGVELIGTPLAAFANIRACGGAVGILNGYCGAESGTVPVSAAAPAIFTAQIETQKPAQAHERLPIMPPPTLEEK